MAALKRQAPPPGPPTDPEYYTWSIQGQLTAIDLSFMLIALTAVLGRCYIRLFVLHVFRLDDYFIVAAMVSDDRANISTYIYELFSLTSSKICSVVGCGIFLHVIQLGMGKHIFALPMENVQPLLMWIWVVSLLIPMSLCFVKLSIAFFLLSLTRGTRYGKFCVAVICRS
jgi:hypothetical protein